MKTLFNVLVVPVLLVSLLASSAPPAVANPHANGDELTAAAVLETRGVEENWISAADMNHARGNHTATLLQDGRVLVVGGYNSVGVVASAEVYTPETGKWVEVASMTTPRQHHTATLLPNGKVLIAGGDDTGMWVSALDSAELFDPSTGTWTPTGSMNQARFLHSANLLSNGKVLVVGGAVQAGVFLSSAELYDPETGTWESTGSTSHHRLRHVTTLLPDGKVMVVGGGVTNVELYDPDQGIWISTSSINNYRTDPTATLLTNGIVILAGRLTYGLNRYYELYDPITGNWTSPLNEMGESRNQHTATLLPNGKLLIAGGFDDALTYLNSTELYDPETDTWTAGPTMSTGRNYHTATLLPNGTVLIVGGSNAFGPLKSVEMYAPPVGDWNPAGSLATARRHHSATLLPDGKVLVVGGSVSGETFNSAELYDPITDTWDSTGNMSVDRWGHIAVLLPNGKVLVAGGSYTIDNVGYIINSAELYDPETGAWESTGSMITARRLSRAALLPSGKVLVFGGWTSGFVHLNSAELYDPVTGIWESTGSMILSRVSFTSTVLSDGKVLAMGGLAGGSTSNKVEIYDPSTGTWAQFTPMIAARLNATATLLADGRVLAVGGHSPWAEIYDPGTGTWELIWEEHNIRQYHTATLLPDGKVLVTGGNDGVSVLDTVEIYDPVFDVWVDIAPMSSLREFHTATLLPNGKVLIASGGPASTPWSSSELFGTELGFTASWQPTIGSVNPMAGIGDSITVTGTGFRGFGNTEASSGSTKSSATNYPLVQLRRLDNAQVAWLPVTAFDASSFTATINGIQAGPAMMTVYVNGIPSLSKYLLIIESLGESPQIISDTSATFMVGIDDEFEIEATGEPLPSISINGLLSDPLPDGLSFIPGEGTATLSGTPGVGTGGVYTLVFEASNGIDPDDLQTFTLLVHEAPEIIFPDIVTFMVREDDLFTVETTGMPIPEITIEGYLPEDVGYVDNDDGTATISGTPAPGTGGIYPLTITASNGVLPDATQAFTLIVQTAEEIDAAGGTITSNGGDIVIQIPADAVSEPVTFTFTPQSEPSQDTGGYSFAGISFTLTAKDGEGDDITTFTEPLLITITYDPDALGELDPETLQLYKWSGEEWEDASCDGVYERVPAENKFSLHICHLCEFAVLGEALTGYNLYLPMILR